MKKYKLSTWKLSVEGEFETEELAITELSDRYMQCSKCDMPGDHPVELLTQKSFRSLEDIAKVVFFYVYEEIYGHKQWILKYELAIHPFKKEHWRENSDGSPIKFEETEFRYKIREQDGKENKK